MVKVVQANVWIKADEMRKNSWNQRRNKHKNLAQVLPISYIVTDNSKTDES